ncbi:MAG TPA: hypothetical protein VLG66_17115 [Alphaproteobacteria bacterium]|nr:hypothetical protein [Alphaproteobacteria bacterium]
MSGEKLRHFERSAIVLEARDAQVGHPWHGASIPDLRFQRRDEDGVPEPLQRANLVPAIIRVPTHALDVKADIENVHVHPQRNNVGLWRTVGSRIEQGGMPKEALNAKSFRSRPQQTVFEMNCGQPPSQKPVVRER